MKTLIKNATIVTSQDIYFSNLIIENDKIVKITDSNMDEDNYNCIIDATNKYVLPGVIDPHTHFEMSCKNGIQSSDDFFTGTVAGACGGVTSVIDFKLQDYGNTLENAIRDHMVIAKKSVLDYSFHVCISDPTIETLNEIKKIIKDYGITSFKVFMTYDFKINDLEFLNILQQVKSYGGILQLHAENHDMIQYMNKKFESENKLAPHYHAKSRPNIAEEEAIFRAIKMNELLDAKLYIVHLSSKEGLRVIKDAQSTGISVYAETCPQYLVLNDNYNNETGWNIAKYSMSPPVRTELDNMALWEGIRDGTIQTIATDHCPFDFYGTKDKFGKDDYKKIPGGLPGIETSLMLVHSEGVVKKRISLTKLVEVMSTNIAKIFKMSNKGEIKPGKDADIVIFDPNQEFIISKDKLHMNVDYSPYEGMKVIGMPYTVFSMGKKIAYWNQDKNMVDFCGIDCKGSFIERK